MRFCLFVEYDGTAYAGWQVQRGQRTIQGEIEHALKIITGERIVITGAGRTDTGVHAKEQVAHFDLANPVNNGRLTRSLNGILNNDIRIIRLRQVHADFHARYDAKLREYRYFIAHRPTALMRNHAWHITFNLDLERMNRAALLITGQHDFKSFCRAKSEVNNHICTVKKAIWTESNGFYEFLIQSDRFLHGMVRALVGTMVDIGRSKKEITSMTDILNKKKRSEAGQAAPAKGLILEKIYY